MVISQADLAPFNQFTLFNGAFFVTCGHQPNSPKMKKLVLSPVFLILITIVNGQTDIIYPVVDSINSIKNCKIVEIVDGNNVIYLTDGVNYGEVRAKSIRKDGNFIILEKAKPSGVIEHVGKNNNDLSNFILDELKYEKDKLIKLEKKLYSLRVTKGIGMFLFFGGSILAGVGLYNYQNTNIYDKQNKAKNIFYIGTGVSFLGLIMWVASPTKHISFQRELTIMRIDHLKRMKTKYDVSLNLTQPKDYLGLGLSLTF